MNGYLLVPFSINSQPNKQAPPFIPGINPNGAAPITEFMRTNPYLNINPAAGQIGPASFNSANPMLQTMMTGGPDLSYTGFNIRLPQANPMVSAAPVMAPVAPAVPMAPAILQPAAVPVAPVALQQPSVQQESPGKQILKAMTFLTVLDQIQGR